MAKVRASAISASDSCDIGGITELNVTPFTTTGPERPCSTFRIARCLSAFR
jgi:hypothetical protein